MTKAQIIDAIKELPPAERGDLIDELSLDLASRPLSDAWKAELQRGWAQHEKDPSNVVSLDDLDRRVRCKYGR